MAQSTSEKVLTPEEVKAMYIQHRKDSILPSLLHIARKLGEVEGMISMQSDPDENLLLIEKDFNRVYDKLLDEAGIDQPPDSENMGIGSDRDL